MGSSQTIRTENDRNSPSVCRLGEFEQAIHVAKTIEKFSVKASTLDTIVREFVGWVEERNPTSMRACWVSLTLYPTYLNSLSQGGLELHQGVTEKIVVKPAPTQFILER